MLQKIILLGLAGGLGTLARYGLGDFIQRSVGGTFPWGTAAVNGAGCFIAGLLWSLLSGKLNLDQGTRMAVFIGFMGAFTTFSSFVLETGHLLSEAGLARAAGNVILQNTAGFLALFLGLSLGRFV